MWGRKRIFIGQGLKDRVQTGFTVLRKRGLLCRSNFSCCSNCALTSLGEMMRERDKRGCVYWHRQDNDNLYASVPIRKQRPSLCLRYGIHPDVPEKDKDKFRRNLGQDIVDTMKAMDLVVEWNGDPNQVVTVRLRK